MTDPLQLPLRDIHLPPAPGWWPPAPGWWLLALLLLVLVAAAFFWRRRREHMRRSAVSVARRELEALRRRAQEQEPVRVVAELSVLLRRLAISLFPRRATAGLTGAEWLGFLDRPFAERPFSEGPGRILVEAPYRPRVDKDEIMPLFPLCESWIEATSKRGARS